MVNFSGHDKTVPAVYRSCAQSYQFILHPGDPKVVVESEFVRQRLQMTAAPLNMLGALGAFLE